MKLIERKNIDVQKWDACIAASPIENVFQYSWYLDAVAPNWSGLITDDYSTLLPVVYTQKLGVRQLIQAPFTREYSIIGDAFNWKEVLAFFGPRYRSIHFRQEHDQLLAHAVKRKHQYLKLSEDCEKNYSTNTKRILKKTHEFELAISDKPELLIELFTKHIAAKIDTISKADVPRLWQLMQSALHNKKGELLLVTKCGEIAAAGFFLLDKSRVTYLKGAAGEEAKKQGAMYFLLHQALQRYKSQYQTFDFGGSEIEKVAEFYHKFGAADRIYFDYTLDNLPAWFRTLKKLKR